VVERFVRWLGEEFHDDVFPPGLAFAGLHAGSEATGALGQLTFAGRRGRYPGRRAVAGEQRVRMAVIPRDPERSEGTEGSCRAGRRAWAVVVLGAPEGAPRRRSEGDQRSCEQGHRLELDPPT
jgi:hypothetical protein